MAAYQYLKEIHFTDAFTQYLQNTYGSLFDHFEFVPPFDDPIIRIFFNRELTEEEHTLLTSRINAYVSPTYFLRFSHTDNAFLESSPTNSTIPIVVQSFIISPYNTADLVMGELKTIIKYECDNLSVFDSFNPEQDPPFTCTLQLYDYTNNNVIYTATENINFIVQQWKTDNKSDPYWKTLQIYGLKDVAPGSDAIWQIKLSVSDPRINVCLNGMQRIFYNVEY